MPTAKETWKLRADNWISTVWISDNGEYISAGFGDYINIFDKNGNDLWHKELNDEVNYSSISNSGDYLAVATRDRNIHFFNKNQDKLLWKYDCKSQIRGVSLSPLNDVVLTGAGDIIHFFDQRGRLVWKYETPDIIKSTFLSTSENKLDRNFSTIENYVIAGCRDKFVYFFDHNGKLLWKYEVENPIEKVMSSKSGENVSVLSSERKVHFLTKSGVLSWKYQEQSELVDISMSENYIVIATEDKLLNFIDFNGKLRHSEKIEYLPLSVTVSSDGNSLVIGTADNHIIFFDCKEISAELKIHKKGKIPIIAGRRTFQQDEIPTCKICLGEMLSIDQTVKCSCGRVFHRKCTRGLERCPFCSNKVPY